jgi:quinol monooxygenase YgiN
MKTRLFGIAATAVVATSTYATLAHAAPTASASREVTAITYIDAIPDQFVPQNEEKARALLKQMNADTQHDPGLVSFTILRETGRPNHFTLLEVWKTDAAFNAHLAAAHTRAFRDALQPLIGSPYATFVTRVAH